MSEDRKSRTSFSASSLRQDLAGFLKARNVQPGETVFLQSKHPLTGEQMTLINTQFKRLASQVHVVILQAGVMIVDGINQEEHCHD